MDWSDVYLLFLLGTCLEVAREVYGTPSWATKHYTRMTQFSRVHKPERDFWTEPLSRREKRVHRQKHHIDLLARPKSIRRKP